MEKENQTEVSFAVDLSKEEYQQFYKIILKYSSASPMQKLGLALVIIMVMVPSVSLYQSGGFAAFWSWDALSVFIPAVLLLLYNHVLLPIFRKRQADRGYDAAVAGGQVFFGTVTVTKEKITKTTSSGSLTMSFSERVLYHEQADMQVFVNAQGRGIILPARCMTAENAQTVRQLATAALPRAVCKIKKPIECQRETPLEYTEEVVITPEFETDITYNAEDRNFVSKEVSARHFKKSFFSNCFISFFAALIFGFGLAPIVGLIIFAGVLLVLTLFLAFTTRRRAKLLLSDEDFRFTFKIAQKALIVDGGARRGVYSIPWKEVRHVYESEKHLEFYSKYHYICVPKRLIADMDSFCRLVDTCRRAEERNG